jgi:hypothetical protein
MSLPSDHPSKATYHDIQTKSNYSNLSFSVNDFQQLRAIDGIFRSRLGIDGRGE